MRCFFAVRTGLEPATPCVTGRYSNQLNYRTNLSISMISLSFQLNRGTKVGGHTIPRKLTCELFFNTGLTTLIISLTFVKLFFHNPEGILSEVQFRVRSCPRSYHG